MTLVAQLQFLRHYENTFFVQRNENEQFTQPFVSPELRLQPLWRVPNNVFYVISIVYSKTRAHEHNLRIYLRLGESVCVRCDTL